MTAHFEIKGTSGTIVCADGTRHALSTVIATACEGLGATMDEFRSENQGGNLSVGFNSSYFPKKGEVTGEQRSALNVRKARAQMAIYDACIDLGIPESAMTFSEGFPGRNGWVGSKRIYFNAPQAQSRADGGTMSEKDQLEAQYMEYAGEIDALLNIQAKLEGKDAMYVGWLRHQVKALKAGSDTASVTASIQADVPEGVPDTSSM